MAEASVRVASGSPSVGVWALGLGHDLGEIDPFFETFAEAVVVNGRAEELILDEETLVRTATPHRARVTRFVTALVRTQSLRRFPQGSEVTVRGRRYRVEVDRENMHGMTRVTLQHWP